MCPFPRQENRQKHHIIGADQLMFNLEISNFFGLMEDLLARVQYSVPSHILQGGCWTQMLKSLQKHISQYGLKMFLLVLFEPILWTWFLKVACWRLYEMATWSCRSGFRKFYYFTGKIFVWLPCLFLWPLMPPYLDAPGNWLLCVMTKLRSSLTIYSSRFGNLKKKSIKMIMGIWKCNVR